MPSRAKLTSRMLLAVPMPMHMMAPVSAGTDSVVPVTKQHPDDARQARAGSAVMMMKGSVQDWKFTTITKYTSTIAPSRPDVELTVGAGHGLHLAAQRDEGAARQLVRASAATMCSMALATAPRSRPWVAA